MLLKSIIFLICTSFSIVLCEENLYDVLGVSHGATTQQIKRAFRKQAQQYHPDKNKSKQAEEMYLKVNRAHEILSDVNKRQRYDRFGEAAFKDDNGHPDEGMFHHAGGGNGFFDFENVFDNIFGSSGSFSGQNDQHFDAFHEQQYGEYPFKGVYSPFEEADGNDDFFPHFGDSFFGGGEAHQPGQNCRTITHREGNRVTTHTECF